MRMSLSTFIQMCVLLFVVLILGCAGTQTTDPWAGFPPQEQASWQEIKATPQFAQEMKSAGITADVAVTWLNSGFSKPTDIIGWSGAGFAPDEAKNWVEKGISLEEAAPWKEYNFSFGEAMDWRNSTKISAETARAWVDRGFTTPNLMKKWNANGFEPFVAEQWAKENFVPETAKKWRDKNFSAKEAAAWNKQGISLSDAITQRAKGLAPKN